MPLFQIWGNLFYDFILYIFYTFSFPLGSFLYPRFSQAQFLDYSHSSWIFCSCLSFLSPYCLSILLGLSSISDFFFLVMPISFSFHCIFSLTYFVISKICIFFSKISMLLPICSLHTGGFFTHMLIFSPTLLAFPQAPGCCVFFSLHDLDWIHLLVCTLFEVTDYFYQLMSKSSLSILSILLSINFSSWIIMLVLPITFILLLFLQYNMHICLVYPRIYLEILSRD